MTLRLLGLFFLIACGAASKNPGAIGASGATGTSGDDTGVGPVGAKAFTVSSPPVSIAQGASKQITLNFSRTGGSFPIEISAGQVPPPGISVTLSAQTVTGNSVNMTITVAPTVAAGSYDIVANAEGAGVTKDVTIKINVTAKSLAAVVVDEFLRPVQGADIYVGSTAKVVSDAQGAFAVAAASAAADIVVRKDNFVWVFKGVTRADPTLQLIGYSVKRSNSARISGEITNAQPVTNGNSVTSLVVAPSTCCADSVINVPSPYDGTFRWAGASTDNVTLHALHYSVEEVAFGLYAPLAFLGYGSKPNVSLTNDTPAPGQNIQLANISTTTLAGKMRLPSGYKTLGRDVSVRLPGQNASLLLMSDTRNTEAFTYQVPQIPGATVGVVQFANGQDGYSYAYASDLTPPQTGVSLTLPAAPKASLPAGSVSATSSFTFTTVNGAGLYVGEFYEDGSLTAPHVFVITSQTSVTLPNIQPYGLAYTSGARYDFIVHGFSTQGVDNAAGAGGFAQPRAAYFTGSAPNGSGTWATSVPKTFKIP